MKTIAKLTLVAIVAVSFASCSGEKTTSTTDSTKIDSAATTTTTTVDTTKKDTVAKDTATTAKDTAKKM